MVQEKIPGSSIEDYLEISGKRIRNIRDVFHIHLLYFSFCFIFYSIYYYFFTIFSHFSLFLAQIVIVKISVYKIKRKKVKRLWMTANHMRRIFSLQNLIKVFYAPSKINIPLATLVYMVINDITYIDLAYFWTESTRFIIDGIIVTFYIITCNIYREVQL